MKAKNCLKCRHFAITFHSGTPYGCKLFRFESHIFPEFIVKSNSGEDCQGFEPKEKKSPQTASGANQGEVAAAESSPDFIVELSRERPKEK